MKKLLIFVISITIVLGAVLFYVSRSQSAPPGAEHIIELSDDGYNPEELTIQKGDTVKFTTTREEAFWPASNLHPSHTIYSKFDPREPIDPKESWSFRFEKVGNWRFHDHLVSIFKGRIIVGE